MIRADMSVTEFLTALWGNKVKIALVAAAVMFGPGLYDSWQASRAAEQLETDRKAVDTNASVAGMMLASAWRSCSEIGIVNDIDGCSKFQARLLQEQAAPMLAKMAVQQREAYWQGCLRFHPQEYCGQLLQRALQLSFTQATSKE